MRMSLVTAGLAALLVAAGTAPATAEPRAQWRVTYVSPDTGYDDFGLYDVTATGRHDAWAVGSWRQGAGGGGAIMRWNGHRWSDVTIPGSTGSFGSVSGSSRRDVWVMGVTANGTDAAWHWDGTAWKSFSTGLYDTADVAVLGPRNAWAVGYDWGGGGSGGEALHWNGGSWKTVPMPFNARHISAVSAKDAWAVGETADQPLAEHWNGRDWTSSKLPNVPIPAGDGGFSYFNDIVAISANDVWAVGRLYWGTPSGGDEPTEHNRPVLMHWNGHKWSLRLGSEGDFALSVSADGNGGIWYSSFNKTLVHVAKSGRTSTVRVPAPVGRQTPEMWQIAAVPGGRTVLAVGEVAPALGGDQSWDAVIEQYR